LFFRSLFFSSFSARLLCISSILATALKETLTTSNKELQVIQSHLSSPFSVRTTVGGEFGTGIRDNISTPFIRIALFEAVECSMWAQVRIDVHTKSFIAVASTVSSSPVVAEIAT